MSESHEEQRIRELVQQVRQRDERTTPSFAATLYRESQIAPASHRLKLVVAVAAFLLLAGGTIGWLRSHWAQQQQAPPHSPQVVDDRQPQESLVNHDAAFSCQQLREAVDEHFLTLALVESSPMWTSNTEMLLAVNLDVTLEDGQCPE